MTERKTRAIGRAIQEAVTYPLRVRRVGVPHPQPVVRNRPKLASAADLKQRNAETGS